MISSSRAVSRNTSQDGQIKKVIAKPKANTIPESITSNKALNQAINLFPANYNFEIHKSVWRIQKEKAKVVALQFPEGLLMYSIVISDIFRKFCNVDTIILGDVTYGACCVDDFTARKLGADMMIHYGHSCLVPVNITTITVMYVFVEIFFDSSHLIETIKSLSFSSSQSQSQTNEIESSVKSNKALALLGTVQFLSVLHVVQSKLLQDQVYDEVIIPQVKPLSQGETLGCTSPIIPIHVDYYIFVADGRFHLEAAMIQNPNLIAYRYDPYSKTLTLEKYDSKAMKSIRWNSIQTAKTATRFGLILGTLGRQGSVTKFQELSKILKDRGKILMPFLMAELNPTKMNNIPKSQVEVWIQVACPRLSIDWGLGFDRPILTPYELKVAMDEAIWNDIYPMDYYAFKK